MMKNYYPNIFSKKYLRLILINYFNTAALIKQIFNLFIKLNLHPLVKHLLTFLLLILTLNNFILVNQLEIKYFSLAVVITNLEFLFLAFYIFIFF